MRPMRLLMLDLDDDLAAIGKSEEVVADHRHRGEVARRPTGVFDDRSDAPGDLAQRSIEAIFESHPLGGSPGGLLIPALVADDIIAEIGEFGTNPGERDRQGRVAERVERGSKPRQQLAVGTQQRLQLAEKHGAVAVRSAQIDPRLERLGRPHHRRLQLAEGFGGGRLGSRTQSGFEVLHRHPQTHRHQTAGAGGEGVGDEPFPLSGLVNTGQRVRPRRDRRSRTDRFGRSRW